MKNKYSLIGSLFILASVFTTLLLMSSLNQPGDEDKRTEILVYIQRDSLDFPSNQRNALLPDEITIRSAKLKRAIEHRQVRNITRGFPDFVEADTLQISENGRLVKLPNFSRVFRFKMNNENEMDSAIAELSRIPGVLFAQRHLDPKPCGDPYYANQWYLKNPGGYVTNPYNLSCQVAGMTSTLNAGIDIKAEDAWAITTGNPNIKIGLFDTGVKLNHEDLVGRVTGDGEYSSDPHGTVMAGLLVANANNSIGIRGVDWNAQVISKRLWNGNNYRGDDIAAQKIIEGVNSGVHILNNSYSGPQGPNQAGYLLRSALAYAYKMNRVVVASMGNNGNSDPLLYPAAFGHGVIAVGAITGNGQWANKYSNFGTHIDLSAPGGQTMTDCTDDEFYDPKCILSTWNDVRVRTDHYAGGFGTSQAAALVSGVASLLKGYNQPLQRRY